MQIINEINDDPNNDPDFGLSVMALGAEYDEETKWWSFLPETFDRPLRVDPGTALCAAVRAGKTRLIDNVLLLDVEAAEREDSCER